MLTRIVTSKKLYAAFTNTRSRRFDRKRKKQHFSPQLIRSVSDCEINGWQEQGYEGMHKH